MDRGGAAALIALVAALGCSPPAAPLTLCALAVCPASAGAGEPPREPFLRLEADVHTAKIFRIASDAAETLLVTGSFDKTARVWDLKSGRLLQVLRPPIDLAQEGAVYAVALSVDGRTVALAGSTGHSWDDSRSIYLFDWASGRLSHRIGGLPHAILDLSFSADGRYLAAALGGSHGVRVYRTADWLEVARDEDYGSPSNSVQFDRAGRLVSASYDSYVRLYDASLHLLAKEKVPGGSKPHSARFSPDGRKVAVGFRDTARVDVISGQDLHPLYAPDTAGMAAWPRWAFFARDEGNLGAVAWSRDGQFLYAGGRSYDEAGWSLVVQWGEEGRGPRESFRASTDTIMDLFPLSGGRLAFASADPSFGVLAPGGSKPLERRGEILNHRHNQARLRLAPDGARVAFGFDSLDPPGVRQRRGARFDLAERRLVLDPADLGELQPPFTEGESDSNWQGQPTPKVRGRSLKLESYEKARSLALSAEGKSFLLGADWYLRYYDAPDTLRWKVAVPGHAWAVNLSADGRTAVAALGDGTLRWYETRRGREMLALFVHPDGVRWIAWTPEGFFDAAPAAETMIGYHLNQGKDRAGEFVAARQLLDPFYQPGLIARRLTPEGDALIAEAVGRLGDVREVLAAGLPPAVELLSPAEASTDAEYELRVRVRDQGGGVSKLVWRIDGVELEGRPAGIPVGDTVSRRFPLAPGRRVITVAARNARGVESEEVRATVQVQPRAEHPDLHVLAVGITRYRDHSLAEGVRFAAEDAEAVADLFRKQGGRLFRSVNVHRPLRDRDATREAIEAAMREMAGAVGANDVFVLFLAGHGFASEGNYHFVPWEARYTNQQALREQSLDQERLRSLLLTIPARKTLVLLDTCSAGAFGFLPGRAPEAKDALDRFSRITGRAVIAATADDKMALEGEADHGVFTYALLAGLSGEARDGNGDGIIDVSELASHLEEQVPAITLRKWGYEQFPFLDIHGNSFPVLRKP